MNIRLLTILILIPPALGLLYAGSNRDPFWLGGAMSVSFLLSPIIARYALQHAEDTESQTLRIVLRVIAGLYITFALSVVILYIWGMLQR